MSVFTTKYSQMTTEQRENHFLCVTHPWLNPEPYNDDFDFSYTIMDLMPDGWRKAFGDAFIKDMELALTTLPLQAYKEFHIVDIQALIRGRLEIRPSTLNFQAVNKVIEKYEAEAAKWCVFCGKPATKETAGGTLFLCDDCFNSKNN